MKKILIVNPICARGHRFYDTEVIKALMQYGKVTAVLKQGYLDAELCEQILLDKDKYPKDPTSGDTLRNKLLHWVRCFQILNKISHKIDFNKYDRIVFLDFNIIIVPYFVLLKNKSSIYLLNHRITTLTTSAIKRLFFKHIPSKINLIAFEDYIKDYLIDEIKVKNKVFIYYHPLSPRSKDRSSQPSEHVDIFAPGYSNDEAFVRELISRSEEINKICAEEKIILTIKTSSINYQSPNFVVTNRFFPKDEYNDLMKNSSVIAQFYSEKFKYTTSGVFFEAVSYGKPIWSLTNNFINNQKHKFLPSIRIFKDGTEFINLLKEFSEGELQKTDNIDDYYQVYQQLQRKQLDMIIDNN